MAGPNLALLFAGLLGGAVVIDYGTKNVKAAFNSGASSGSSSSTGPGSGAVVGKLTGKASTELTSGQQTFASRLSQDTGLDINVISAWLLAEESGSAAQYYQSMNFNDWLNIGQTGSGDYSNSDAIWKDPATAADATAAWLHGVTGAVPGYGSPSQGIRSILTSIGQGADAQIHAIQSSGWASSGYPLLGEIYSEIAG